MMRVMTNILTDDLNATVDTFVLLLNFKIEFEADWFVSMVSEGGNDHISAFKRDSEFIPTDFQQYVQGVVITFVVDEVEDYYQKAKDHSMNIVEDPKDLPYGQRRMLVLDPSGLLLDISSPTAKVDSKYI